MPFMCFMVFVSEKHALEAVCQATHIEVYEKALPHSEEPHVRQQLRLMNR